MIAPGKHAALAAELERKRQDRMAKLGALWGTGNRRAKFSEPEDEVEEKPRRLSRGKLGPVR
ncbi:hypothetical protein [Azospirillum sp.]|uniref:hypothetical protein n=1 Tax=Azospirillum sp. TaxID=34012 RepID=UPI003D764357